MQVGQVVDSAQVLMVIDNTNPELNSENARLALDLARKNYQGNASALKSLKLQIDLSAIKLKDDSINYERQKSLFEQNIGSQLELEKKKLAFDNALRQHQLLEMQYEQTRNQSETNLLQAENNYELSRQNAGEFMITSVMHGKVYDILKEHGEVVRFQESVAVIGEEDAFYLELEVDQEDISKVNIDQEVFIRLDAFPDKIATGKIRKLTPLMNPVTQTFMAEVSLDAFDEQLFPGLTGEANVVISKKEDALHIPLSYLVNDSTVLVKGKEVTIRTGLQSLDQIEVLSGLEAGMLIQKPQEE